MSNCCCCVVFLLGRANSNLYDKQRTGNEQQQRKQSRKGGNIAVVQAQSLFASDKPPTMQSSYLASIIICRSNWKITWTLRKTPFIDNNSRQRDWIEGIQGTRCGEDTIAYQQVITDKLILLAWSPGLT